MAKSKDIFLTDFDHPFRWEHDCDLATTTNERAINNNLKSISFQRKRGFFLEKNIGSRNQLQVFEPNDVITEEIINSDVMDAIIEQEDRVIVADRFTFTKDSSGRVLKAIIYYKYKNTNEGWKTQAIELT